MLVAASGGMDPFALPATQDDDDNLAVPEGLVKKNGRAARLSPRGQPPAQASKQQPRYGRRASFTYHLRLYTPLS